MHYSRNQQNTMSYFVQAKEALQSAYFDDLDKEAVDALESDVMRAREG